MPPALAIANAIFDSVTVSIADDKKGTFKFILFVKLTAIFVFTGRMFEYAKSFNQNLEKWNVSKVEYMEDMFNGTGMTVLPKWYNG
mgnify:CR=1 FL=1